MCVTLGIHQGENQPVRDELSNLRDGQEQLRQSTEAGFKSIRAVLFEDQGWWILQGLEVDLAAQGHSRSEVVAAFERLLVARVLVGAHLGVNPFADLPKAPQRFWDLYGRASSSEHRDLKGPEKTAQLPSPLPTLELRTAA